MSKNVSRASDLNRAPNRKEAPAQQANTKRLNRRDMDSACYRLSRVPQKYSMTKAVKAETSESFAVTYYSSNPVDTRTPQEKLDEVDSKLSECGVADNDERFNLLVQKKSLCQMIYGENSPEAVKASTEFGAFYNAQDKPESALRNLNKAHQSSKMTQLEEDDGFILAVELADASLNAKQPSKQDKHKQIVVADNALTPYAETETGTPQIMYRKDLCLARIRAYRQKFEEAIGFYEKALGEYASAKENKKEEAEQDENKENQQQNNHNEEEENKEDIVEPNLYVEAAQIAEKAQNTEKSGEWYKKAYDLYQSRGFEAEAKKVEPKVPKESDGQENQKEEEQVNEEQQEDEADQPAEMKKEEKKKEEAPEEKPDDKAEEEKGENDPHAATEEPAANGEEPAKTEE